jgi:lactate racemase
MQFAYGENGLELNLPDDLHIDIIRAKEEKILDDPVSAIIEAMDKPLMSKSLKAIIKNKIDGKICIVVSDSTRPVPSKIILTAIFKQLDELKIPDVNIKILIATGLHRKSSPQEMDRILGKEILNRYDIINHVAEDNETLEYLGENSLGSPVYINKLYLESDIKIITGYVEPHFFAGFSGGRKSIVPGIAGAESIKCNHSAKNIASNFSRFGILKENPIFQDAIDTAKMKKIRPDFMVNVCIDPKHKITKIIAGSLQAYNELAKYQENLCFNPIEELYDVVISGNGGYPLDLNLYQGVKSMAIGEMAVKDGGTIISVNECRDGVGQPKFKELINLGMIPKELYQRVCDEEITCKDQWEIQVMSRVLAKAEVRIVSQMKADELGNIGLIHNNSVEEAIEQCREKYGSSMKILILPDGPLALPRLN